MSRFEESGILNLLSIIPDHPATRIMHITKDEIEFVEQIKRFVEIKNYEYLINTLDRHFLRDIEELKSKRVSIKYVSLKQRRYVNMAKLYDFVFVTTIIPDRVLDIFLNRIHSHIRNAGNIIFLIERDRDDKRYRLYDLLEKNYFVATNSIDIFRDYEVVISKKMHGWG
ncbi:MAG: hypothetical protein GXO06_00475, partial [Epsilonproteobacteria bacterium]|nr:hypothetical protein [Campylobacterota bacterium]